MHSSITVAALVATGLILVGGATAPALGGDDPTGAVTPASASASAGGQPANAPQPAVDRAAAEEFDDHDDRDHWEIEVRNDAADRDVDVDAATGEILDSEIDNDDRDDRGAV